MPQSVSCDHAHLLARARAVLERPYDFEAKAVGQLIQEISAAEDRLSRSIVPGPVEIHLAYIDHRQGTNFYAAFTREALIAEVAGFCRKYWATIETEQDPSGLDDEKLVEAYFHDAWEDYFYSDCTTIAA